MNTTLLSGEKATQQDVDEAKARLPRSSSSLKLEAYHIYSPEEHIVGEWQEMIDGVLKKKPVYEKRADFSSLTGGIVNNIPHNIENLDEWIYATGKYGNVSIERAYTAAGAYDSCRKASSHIDGINATNISLYIGAAYPSGLSGFVIIQYTKTTDLWEIV